MSNTGKLMIFLAWIGAAGLLTWLFWQELDHQRNPNQAVDSRDRDGGVEVRLQRNRIGHYVATGLINGEPVEFILDTGATHVAIGEPLAAELGLERGARNWTRTANGTIATYQTVLESVTLGLIEIRNVTASINPGMQGKEVLLGMSFLKQLELVQRGEVLLLRQAAD